MIYRIKQFFTSVTAKINSDDIKYLKKNLNKSELALFLKLKKSEQKHCIKVSKDVEQICFHNDIKCDKLLKVALLHDIGKTEVKLNLIEKAILVILDKITNGRLKNNKNKKVYIYYNHGKVGAKLLENYGYDKRFLYLIENHHNKNIKNDKELEIIIYSDNKN